MSPAGVTLNGEKPSETWTQQIYGRPGNELITKLSIKQVLLGHDAKKDEVNVVEVTTESWKKDGSNQKIPIAVLKLGETQSTAPNFEFPSVSVTFKLIAGTGPVHIAGLQFPDSFEDTLEQGEVRGRLLLYDPDWCFNKCSLFYSTSTACTRMMTMKVSTETAMRTTTARKTLMMRTRTKKRRRL